MLRVYPRVGGGNERGLWHIGQQRGLSPRGRGKRYPGPGCPPAGRSIPAWAGETAGTVEIRLAHEVYPRVGGGNAPGQLARLVWQGLSPRGRGKLRRGLPQFWTWRSIPAWAGET